jgi:serine/threonine-protein kinase
MQRNAQQNLSIQLYTEKEIGCDYIYIPQGSFPFGGDPEAPMSLPLTTPHLDDFFISKHPITFGEYLAYLDDLHQRDPALAASLVPRYGQETYAILQDGRYIPHRKILLEGAITARYPEGQGHEYKLPVLGLSWYEAILYCRWRSQREGRLVTLPTEEQWEKAASGVDRRIFPWGDHFDATFCKMGRSRPSDELQPEPIGIFEADRSPYGVCDIVGTISEWTLPIPQKEVDSLLADPKLTPIQRGGGWIASNEQSLRLRMRLPRPEGTSTYNCGFRVVAYPRHKN